MTRNFKAKEIELEFDEFFKLSNQYQEITLSPATEKAPEYKIRGQKLVIEFKDTLQKNTTYVLNFGKAIQDVNESNVVKNFTYVFSTGNHIDSLSISGTVTNSQTQEKEKDITVMLIPVAKDSVIFGKKKPSIFTTTDSSGNFSLNNLREDTYNIYALKEASPNKIFDNDLELIAFLKNPIKVTKDTSNVNLVLFQQSPEKFRFIERRFDNDGKIMLYFNKPLVNPSVKIVSPPALNDQKIVDINTTRDSALVFMRTMDFDSVKIAVFENNKPLDTVTLRKSRKESFQKGVTLKYNITADGKLKPGTNLRFMPSIYTENVNPTLITLKEDSAMVTNFTVSKDTSNVRDFTLKYRWKQNAKYELTFNEGAITDIFGNKNKKQGKQFTIDKPENYGVLTLKVKVPEAGKNYVVQIFRDEKSVLRSDVITKNSSIVYGNYPTAKYRIKVIYDTNKNGKWDSGSVKQKLQPEHIWISDKEITLRPNWEAEESVDIPKEPATP
ncbi:Ig-like domain-containing protein [Mucilaginibacter gynuensis]|uniref:Ig-like domain-containing protein n=2 Tax=Mucilaginibacter gynuensis TaxID=1302236 RepID=A0ABP8HD15_9SPHI